MVYVFVHGSNFSYLLLKINDNRRNEGYIDKRIQGSYGYKSIIPRNIARRFRVASEYENIYDIYLKFILKRIFITNTNEKDI